MSLRPVLLVTALGLLSCAKGEEPCERCGAAEEGETTLAVEVEPPVARVAPVGADFLSAEDGTSHRRDGVLNIRARLESARTERRLTARLESEDGVGRAATFEMKFCPESREAVCGAVELPLASAPFRKLRGSLSLMVLEGNGESAKVLSTTAVPVTRALWRRKVGASVKATPAMHRGNVYVATADDEARVWALGRDGEVLWRSTEPMASIVSSPGVFTKSDELLIGEFARGRPSRLLKLRISSGLVVGRCAHPDLTGGIELSPAIVETQPGAPRAFVHLMAGEAGGIQLTMDGNRCVADWSSGYGFFPGNIVRGGGYFNFGGWTGSLVSHRDSGDLAPEVQRPFKADDSDVGRLAFNGTDIITGSNHGTVLSLPASVDAGAGYRGESTTATRPTEVHVVDGEGFVYLAASEGRLIKSHVGGAAPQLETVFPKLIATSLLGGASQHPLAFPDTKRLGYSLSNTGHLLVWDPVTLKPEWSVRLTNDGFLASPTLQCLNASNRNDTAGVLYAASSSGEVFAIIVDSPYLDPASPWPKYQGHPSNGGGLDAECERLTGPVGPGR